MSIVYMYRAIYIGENINSDQTCVDWIVVLWHEQSRVTADKFRYHGNVPKQFVWKPLWSRYQFWYWQRLQVRQLLVLKFLFSENMFNLNCHSYIHLKKILTKKTLQEID